MTYCGTELDGLALKVSMLPSQRGNESLLSDVLEAVAGNVIRPVAREKGYAADPAPRTAWRSVSSLALGSALGLGSAELICIARIWLHGGYTKTRKQKARSSDRAN